jgi:hypothetical protein
MKKITLFLAAGLLLLATGVGAQTLDLGVKAGATLGKIDGQSFKDGYNFGIHAGFFAEIGLGEKFGIQPEVLFNQTKTQVKESVDAGDVLKQGSKGHLNYLSIPVLLNFKPAQILTIQAGPQFGILMNKDNSLVENGKDAFKSGDFAIALGAQVNLGSLKVYGRYNIGLSDARDVSDVTDQSKWKNQQIQLGIGYVIF